MRGKLAEAVELWTVRSRRGACSAPPALAGNLFNRSSSRSPPAISTSRSRTQKRRRTHERTRRASCRRGLRWARPPLLEEGDLDRAVELLLGRAGGEELTLIPGNWRAYCLELLTRCWLALDRRHARPSAQPVCPGMRQRTGAPTRHRVGGSRRSPPLPWTPGTPTARPNARSLPPLPRRGRSGGRERALTHARRPSARRAGQRDQAVEELQRAAAAFDGCGASLPRTCGARARKARPPPPPPLTPGRTRRTGSGRSPNGSSRWHDSSSNAGRIRRSPPSSSSARRRSSPTCATSSRSSTSPHASTSRAPSKRPSPELPLT